MAEDDLPDVELAGHDWTDKSDRELLDSARMDLREALVHPGLEREGHATSALAKLIVWKRRQRDGEPVDHGDEGFWDDAVRADDAQESLSWAMFTWGHEAQLGMLGEEADELSRAVHRLQNGREDDLKQLVEEIADVRVVMEQIAHHVTDDALEAQLDAALDQLDDKLDAGDLNGD